LALTLSNVLEEGPVGADALKVNPHTVAPLGQKLLERPGVGPAQRVATLERRAPLHGRATIHAAIAEEHVTARLSHTPPHTRQLLLRQRHHLGHARLVPGDRVHLWRTLQMGHRDQFFYAAKMFFIWHQ